MIDIRKSMPVGRGSRPKQFMSIANFSDSILWKVPEHNGTRKLYKNRRVATTFTILVYSYREGNFQKYVLHC